MAIPSLSLSGVRKLSTSYKTIQGDTFTAISRKSYGTEEYDSLIARANPGTSEPFLAGIVLFIPDIQGAPKDVQQQVKTDNPDEVAILINGKRFRFWTEVSIRFTLDSIDTISFQAPFDHSISQIRKVLKPFSFSDVIITIGGKIMFNGTMVTVEPVVNNNQKSLNVSCYSKPGVLADCTAPVSAYPMGFAGLRFEEIANRMVSTFGITVLFDADPGPVFTQGVNAETDAKILNFLNGLARQRNAVLTNDIEGNLIYKQSKKTGEPVAIFRQGESPLVSVKPKFKPQKYYSHVSGVDPVIVEIGGNFSVHGGKHTVNNPFLNDVHRPLTFRTDDTGGPNIVNATKTMASRMFANAATYDITVATWRDSKDRLFEPDTFVKVFSPDAMIFKESDFIVRRVTFSETSFRKLATLSLILPGGFSGELPESLPWED
jgi:prophage tail gpP-like protein